MKNQESNINQKGGRMILSIKLRYKIKIRLLMKMVRKIRLVIIQDRKVQRCLWIIMKNKIKMMIIIRKINNKIKKKYKKKNKKKIKNRKIKKKYKKIKKIERFFI